MRAHRGSVLGRRRHGRPHHVGGVDRRGLVELHHAGRRRVPVARAQGLGLAARRPACGGHAFARMVRPLAERRAGRQQDAGHEQGDDEHVHAEAPDDAVQHGPQSFAGHAAVHAHVGVAEETLRPLAGEDAERVGGRGQDKGDDDHRDPPAHPAARAAVVAGHQHVGDEAEQQREREDQEPHQPARDAAQPAPQRPAVPAEIDDEGEEHGESHAGDRRQLVAVTRGRSFRARRRAGGARSRARRSARAPCLLGACSRHRPSIQRGREKP